jgi:hypothetical protein
MQLHYHYQTLVVIAILLRYSVDKNLAPLCIYAHLASDLAHSDMNCTGFVTEEGLSPP